MDVLCSPGSLNRTCRTLYDAGFISIVNLFIFIHGRFNTPRLCLYQLVSPILVKIMNVRYVIHMDFVYKRRKETDTLTLFCLIIIISYIRFSISIIHMF